MNNKSNRLIVAFLGMAFTAGTFLSCKEKNPNANCKNCHSVLEAKEYFAFKEGSYWVYEEETTHERDSMYVTQSWISSGYDFYVIIKSQLTDFKYTYWPTYFPQAGSCSTTGGVNSKCLFVYRNKSKPLNNLGDTRAMFINYSLGSQHGTAEVGSICNQNVVKILDIKESFNNGFKNFGFTIKLNESCSYHYDQQSVNLYYSKGVGIVRKELVDSNQVWNLVKYNIVI